MTVRRPTRGDAKRPTRGATSKSGSPGTKGPRGAGAQPAGSERVAKVGERIRKELSEMFLRGEVRDPAAQGVLVAAVKVTSDLSLARIYVRLLEAESTAQRQRDLLKALERAKGHIRHTLGGRLELRIVPELRFAWDDTTDRAARIDELLADIAAERTVIADGAGDES